MIYLDNAATGFPKSPAVTEAVTEAVRQFGNPGRGGHAMSLAAADAVYRCRRRAAAYFHLPDPARVVFTPNCTASLNTVIKSLQKDGKTIVTSDMEHNSVMRPLAACGGFSVARVGERDEQTLDNFRRLIRRDTGAIVCLHASNVFGNVLPIAALGRLARENGLIFAVDAAQSAGILPIDMEEMAIDVLCAPGHKGLGGPAGTGLLLCGERYTPHPLMEGGSGTESLSSHQPAQLPERLECGTLNTPGICGLSAALREKTEGDGAAAYQHEMEEVIWLYDRLSERGCYLYTPRPVPGRSVPLLSFNLPGKTSEETAALLNEYGVAVRAGYHCAPAAHRHAGTLSGGTVRVSPGAYTDPGEIREFIQIIDKIL